MKKTLLALLLAASTLGASPLPSFKHLPHYLGYMKCELFANEATALLQSRGIESRVVYYRWQGNGMQGFHAAVLLKHEGKFYFMDNDHARPVPVGQRTDWGCIMHCTPGDTSVFMKDSNGWARKPQAMSELFAPAPEWMKSIQVGAK